VSDIKGGHRLKIFEKRVSRKMFGPKRDEMTGGWRKLQNEELHEEWCLLGCYAVWLL
jgi:hypothetical protein